jgi:hypothetical protein
MSMDTSQSSWVQGLGHYIPVPARESPECPCGQLGVIAELMTVGKGFAQKSYMKCHALFGRLQ